MYYKLFLKIQSANVRKITFHFLQKLRIICSDIVFFSKIRFKVEKSPFTEITQLVKRLVANKACVWRKKRVFTLPVRESSLCFMDQVYPSLLCATEKCVKVVLTVKPLRYRTSYKGSDTCKKVML